MKEEIFEIWDNKDEFDEPYKQMGEKMKKYLRMEYPEVDDVRQKIAILKRDFESDLPHRAVMEATGCDIEMCQRIRWRGKDYGVMDNRG